MRYVILLVVLFGFLGCRSQDYTFTIRVVSEKMVLSESLVFEYYMEFLKDTAWLKEHVHAVDTQGITDAFLEWLAVHITRSDLLHRNRFENATQTKRPPMKPVRNH